MLAENETPVSSSGTSVLSISLAWIPILPTREDRRPLREWTEPFTASEMIIIG